MHLNLVLVISKLWYTGSRIKQFIIMVLNAVNALHVLNFLFQAIDFYRARNPIQNLHRRGNIGNVLNCIQILFNFAKWLLRRWKKKRKNLNTPNIIIKLLGRYRCQRQRRDFWNNLERNWTDFFWLTGETPDTLSLLVNDIYCFRRRIIGRWYKKGRRTSLTFRNQVLLTIIWLRRYPTFYHLAHHFDIPVNVVHKTIFRIIPLLHNHLVPKYIKWPNDNEWISMRGTFPEWPNVVGLF